MIIAFPLRKFDAMKTRSLFLLPLLLASLTACVSRPAIESSDETPGLPRHLALARELVRNIAPENNRYVLGGTFLRMPSDPEPPPYYANVDCSVFVGAMFGRGNAPDFLAANMAYRPDSTSTSKKWFLAEDFWYSIQHEKGFMRIDHIADIRAGDVLAYTPRSQADKQKLRSTGHVVLVNGTAEAIEARAPLVAGTRQYRVSIIDANRLATGPDDTRSLTHSTGVGMGFLRLYADENGRPVGYARPFSSTKFISWSPDFPSTDPETIPQHVAIGRAVRAK